MFALITSEGAIHFKVDDSNRKEYKDAGSGQHMKMPYFEVPNNIRENKAELEKWAQDSIAIAHSSKNKKN